MAKHPPQGSQASRRPGSDRPLGIRVRPPGIDLPFHPSPLLLLLPSPLPRGVSPGLGSVEGGK